MIKVKSTITINTNRIRELRQAHKTALVQTAEKLHTAVVQAKVVPRMDGHLQNEKFYVDTSKSHLGKVRLVFEGPYARRWYYNPETVYVSEYIIKKGERKGEKIKSYIAHKATFSKAENPNATDHWFNDWLPGGKYQDFVRNTYAELLKKNGGL